jgi:hypothetical protein
MMVALKKISGKVGRGASNSSSDVKTVQTLLNKFTSQASFSKLKEDGVFGPKTEAALQAFQRKVMNASSPKKVIEPGGDVLKHLNARIRDLKTLAKSWVGIDLEDDGAPEVLSRDIAGRDPGRPRPSPKSYRQLSALLRAAGCKRGALFFRCRRAAHARLARTAGERRR